MMEQAVVVTYNWKTHEIMSSTFEGPDAGIHAHQFKDGEVKRGDFPEPEWAWFVHMNDAAAERRSQWLMEKLGLTGTRGKLGLTETRGGEAT